MKPPALDTRPPARVQLVVALSAEARPLIEHFGLAAAPKRAAFREFTRPETGIRLAVTGSGREKAAAAVAQLGPVRDAVWLNVGIAGHAHHRLGDVFIADRIVDDRTGKTWHPRLNFAPSCPTASLRTVARECLDFPTDDLYDMEAAGFYETAIRFARPELVHCLKVVSDNLSRRASTLTPARVTELISSNLALIARFVDLLGS